VDEVVAQQPDVVVVSAGFDDVEGDSPLTKIHSAVNRTYRQLRAGLPQARLVAVAPLYPDSNPPPKVRRMGRFIESAASRVNADFVDTGPWLDELALRLADDVNANDAGNRMIAVRLDSTLS
jgi:lysophospholipase L1-like esterase